MAADLSKDRKGGLSALFENKKKVFYGVGAFMFTSVMAVGGLASLGIIDFGGTKASVTESPKVVAVAPPVVKTPKTPPVVTPDVLAASGATTQTGTMSQTGTTTSTGQALYPPIVVTSSGTSMVVGGTGAVVMAKGTGTVLVATGATLSGTGT